MADNAKTVAIGFGNAFTPDYNKTGSLWDYRYAGPEEQYSGRIDPIFGPGCKIHPNKNYACYAAPTGSSSPEGVHKYDYMTLKPGHETYVYLDVGFWGKTDRRTFGLICGPHVWLCDYSQHGEAPEPDATDLFARDLYFFHRDMGKFKVVNHATAPLDNTSGTSQKLYLILPDMHMWPNPEELKRRRREFFEDEESKQLDSGLKDGTLIKNPDGSIDIPIQQGESADDHALRLQNTPQGRAAMKENSFSDTQKMHAEEEAHAFGPTAGSDLVRLLQAVDRARQNPDSPFDVTLLHVGDLLEMWAPYHTWVGSNPFNYMKDGLKLTDEANQRIPKWIDLIYGYGHNRSALQQLAKSGCRQLYGNHDVYLGFDKWKPTNAPTMDRLKDSPGFFSEGLLWVEHGHRFDPSNRDGYWLWIDINQPPGAVVNTAVNYYPDLRDLGDQYDNSDSNLYKKNVPYATIWFLLANYATLDDRPRLPDYPSDVKLPLPPPFRIFCQGHTHSPVLLKVEVVWSRATGKYAGSPDEADVTKEEQDRQDGTYKPAITNEQLIELIETNREERVQRDRESRGQGGK